MIRDPYCTMIHFAKALALVTLAATPASAEDWSSLLLDRTVTITLPDNFAPEPAFSDASSGAAIVEFLPPGETVEAWSQMLTLTGYDDNGSLAPDQAATGMANHLAEGYGNACPGSFAAEDLGAPAVSGAEAVFAAWLACGDAGGSGHSEAMVVLVFSAGGTVYTAQWAERGPATSGPPVFDLNQWLPRLDALMALQL
jgi:hypothetical protein